MSRGKFIVFEGCEGSGKSTQLAKLADWLESKGISVYKTKEPGGTSFGKELRDIILYQTLNPVTELMLLMADRSQHIQNIKDCLDSGYWVLCDRFVWSTLAYQGYGRGHSLELLNQINKLACQGLSPDWTILLDIDPKLGLSRKQAQGEINKFEIEDLSFHNRVREGYLKIFEQTLLDDQTKETLIYCQSKLHHQREVDQDTILNTIINSFPFNL